MVFLPEPAIGDLPSELERLLGWCHAFAREDRRQAGLHGAARLDQRKAGVEADQTVAHGCSLAKARWLSPSPRPPRLLHSGGRCTVAAIGPHHRRRSPPRSAYVRAAPGRPRDDDRRAVYAILNV